MDIAPESPVPSFAVAGFVYSRESPHPGFPYLAQMLAESRLLLWVPMTCSMLQLGCAPNLTLLWLLHFPVSSGCFWSVPYDECLILDAVFICRGKRLARLLLRVSVCLILEETARSSPKATVRLQSLLCVRANICCCHS